MPVYTFVIEPHYQ